jgi:hypothetical protein
MWSRLHSHKLTPAGPGRFRLAVAIAAMTAVQGTRWTRSMSSNLVGLEVVV